jgi:hypothetical protein
MHFFLYFHLLNICAVNPVLFPVEVAKKVVGGAANVLGNISGEIKKGIGEK